MSTQLESLISQWVRESCRPGITTNKSAVINPTIMHVEGPRLPDLFEPTPAELRVRGPLATISTSLPAKTACASKEFAEPSL